ncbi:hypothetical protein ALQ04_03632 [Pseudomonas cichorii]|uniref:Uncharacterized protein n=2 Tax=Pseudomonas cichorii TaxID=36746 RepID=A0A3M4LF28_PSECI|nr:hypothetical protein ALQ04_03632 [Pseudomonas cichorii]
MTGNLIQQSDLTGLDNHMRVLQKLPEFTRSFKVNLDLVPAREYGSYRIPEIAALLSKASDHLSLGSKVLPALTALHRELEAFLEDIIPSTESISGSQDVTRHFIEQSKSRLGMFMETFDDHQRTLQTLTRGIYTILPRVIDFLNGNIYRHAHQYDLMERNGEQNAAMQNLTASISFAETGPALSPQARLRSARSYVVIAQRQYAEALCAATNMDAYITRVCDVLGLSFAHTLRMRKTDNPSRPYLETRLMLVSLKEVQRFTRWFNSLTANPV